MKKTLEEQLKNAIIKKAKGFDTSETVEEYQGDDGVMVLTKKKVTKKFVPPDTQAVKMLLDLNDEQTIESLSDEELENERIRLLNLLKEYDKNKEKKNEN